MLRVLLDENFNNDVRRGLLLRAPAWELPRVQDTDAAGADDPAVLAYAAAGRRSVVTHDRATMPAFAFERMRVGEPFFGLIVVHGRLPLREIIDELLLVGECVDQSELMDRVLFLPL